MVTTTGSLSEMVGKRMSITEIGAALDAMDAESRWAELQTMGRAEMRQLYVLAADARPLCLSDFVPTGVAPLEPVVHRGRNSLPLPQGQRLFSKVMCRPRGEPEQLYGYNDAPLGWVVGPGYFVALSTDEGSAERGAVVVDYYQVPTGSVPDGWPRVRANWVGLQLFVYDRTRDYMRRVSSHVTIGAAYKFGRKLDHYFVLDRLDAPSG